MLKTKFIEKDDLNERLKKVVYLNGSKDRCLTMFFTKPALQEFVFDDVDLTKFEITETKGDSTMNLCEVIDKHDANGVVFESREIEDRNKMLGIMHTFKYKM